MFIMLYDTESESRNAGSFLRKKLGEALRIGPKDSGLTAQRLLPAELYLTTFLPFAILTEILR